MGNRYLSNSKSTERFGWFDTWLYLGKVLKSSSIVMEATVLQRGCKAQVESGTFVKNLG